MKYTAAKFAVVATLAVCVGIFFALVAYATLIVAVLFLVVAAGVALLLRRRKHT